MDYRLLQDYNGIVMRVYIQEENGNEVAYIYESELFQSLVKKESWDGYTTSLNVGDVLEFTDASFKIKNIKTSFEKEINVEWMNYGTNMFGIGEQLPYNFTITYIVEKV